MEAEETSGEPNTPNSNPSDTDTTAAAPVIVQGAVEALSWDITLGIAKTKFGKFALNKTSGSKLSSIEGVDHVGLKVFGHVYEYGDDGILKSPVRISRKGRVKSKYPTCKLRIVEYIGETLKSEEEFDAWVAEKSQNEFRGSNYDLVKKSCVVWGLSACNYLEVPPPQNWNEITEWAEHNASFADFVGKSGLASRSSSRNGKDLCLIL